MAYETPTFDSSQRNKMMGQLDQFYNIPQYQQMLASQGRQALQQNFGAAQDRIGAQFQPVQRMATARLAGSPLLADSGYANRLNRQIQTSAFGDLSRAYGDASAENANSQLSALERLIQARFGATNQMFGNAQRKQKIGDQFANFAGQAVGAYVGSQTGRG
jgi:hypothetical protein